MNIQRLEIDPDTLSSYYESTEYKNLVEKTLLPNQEQINSIITDIQKAKRPIILV